MKPGVSEVPMPAASRALSTLSSIDYEDAFLVDVRPAQRQSPEQWAREFFAGAPAPMRTTLPRAWFALGLELGPTDSDSLVFGWDVRQSTPDHVLLGADSRSGCPASCCSSATVTGCCLPPSSSTATPRRESCGRASVRSIGRWFVSSSSTPRRVSPRARAGPRRSESSRRTARGRARCDARGSGRGRSRSSAPPSRSMIASARKVAWTPAMSMPKPVQGSWCMAASPTRAQPGPHGTRT